MLHINHGPSFCYPPLVGCASPCWINILYFSQPCGHTSSGPPCRLSPETHVAASCSPRCHSTGTASWLNCTMDSNSTALANVSCMLRAAQFRGSMDWSQENIQQLLLRGRVRPASHPLQVLYKLLQRPPSSCGSGSERGLEDFVLAGGAVTSLQCVHQSLVAMPLLLRHVPQDLQCSTPSTL